MKVWAKGESQFYDGSIESAVAAIRGYSDEEVLVLAHICHPKPSSNDNASGCAAAMEAARALRRLIDRGELPRPRRTIRFMLMPEMTGTYAWLAEDETRISRTVAALNLDMVGEDQNLCGGPLIVERTPEATPSYTNALLESILDEVKLEGRNLAGTTRYPLFKHAITSFSGGSDHYILNDPSVGIPCPMMIQWPDRFYHTSYDTPDKVDPEMLRKVALMAATYAYFIANAGPEEALWLTGETAARRRTQIASFIRAKMCAIMEEAEKENPEARVHKGLKELEGGVRFLSDRGIEAVKSIRRLTGGSPAHKALEEREISTLETFAEGELQLAEYTLKVYLNSKGIKLTQRGLEGSERDAASTIPRRLHRGPPSTRSWIRRLSRQERDALWRLEREHREGRILGTLALYWADGRRSLLEIADLVELETGRRDLDYLVEYFNHLERMGLIELVREQLRSS